MRIFKRIFSRKKSGEFEWGAIATVLGHENIAYSPWLILPPPSHPIAKFREVTQQLVFNSCLVHTGLFFYFARKVFYRREQNELSNALSARDPDESNPKPIFLMKIKATIVG